MAIELGLYEKALPNELSWEEKLIAAREAGFDYVEISVDESDERQARLDWTREERAALRDAIWKTGLPLGSMCLSGHRKWPLGSHDAEVRKQSLTIMQKALDLASDLGIHTIQLAGYDVYYEEGDADTVTWFGENLAICAEMSAQAGVMCGFETMETPFMDTVEKSMRWVSEINNPYLGVYPDCGNLSNAALLYGTSVHDDILTGTGHIVAAHLKPTVKGQYRDLYFGEGDTNTTDWDGALSALIPMGVRRYVTELWYHEGRDFKADIADANAFARALIAKHEGK